MAHKAPIEEPPSDTPKRAAAAPPEASAAPVDAAGGKVLPLRAQPPAPRAPRIKIAKSRLHEIRLLDSKFAEARNALGDRVIAHAINEATYGDVVLQLAAALMLRKQYLDKVVEAGKAHGADLDNPGAAWHFDQAAGTFTERKVVAPAAAVEPDK